MSVRPVLLGLYEKYFLPLQKLLLPSLQAFVIGLLPGLEEGSEIYDRWVSQSRWLCPVHVVGQAALLCVTAFWNAGTRGAGKGVGVGPMVCIPPDRVLCSPGSTSIFSERQEARLLRTVTQSVGGRGDGDAHATF